MLRVVGKIPGGAALFRRERLHPRTIQLDGEDPAPARIPFVGGKEYRARLLVHSADLEYLIVATLELAFALGVRCKRILFVEPVEVHVGVSIDPAGPEETVAGFQDAEVVIHIDPTVGDRLG